MLDVDAPEHQVAELIDGELFLSPEPTWGHATATTVLSALLCDAFQLGRSGPGGWTIVDEPELHLIRGKRVLVPDLAGWLERRRTISLAQSKPPSSSCPTGLRSLTSRA